MAVASGELDDIESIADRLRLGVVRRSRMTASRLG